MILSAPCTCLCAIYWSQVLSREWRCSWSSANRRCSNYIWVINNLIAYYVAYCIRGLTVMNWENSKFSLNGQRYFVSRRLINLSVYYPQVSSNHYGYKLSYSIVITAYSIHKYCNVVCPISFNNPHSHNVQTDYQIYHHEIWLWNSFRSLSISQATYYSTRFS